jgi:hypothetical protein
MQVRTGTTLTMTTTTGAGHTTRVTGIMKTTATTMTGVIAKAVCCTQARLKERAWGA